MNLLDRIYNATRTPQQPTPPVTAPDGQQFVNTPASIVGPRDNASILQVIGGLLAPEANSFWANATKHGLSQAKTAQAANVAAQHTAGLDTAKKELELITSARDAKYDDSNVGGRVVRRGADGDYKEIYAPSTPPTEVERLIEQWKSAPPGPLKELIARAIRGYQYSDEFIERKGEDARRTVVTKEQNRRFAPRANAPGPGGLPPGAMLLPPGQRPPGL